MSEPNGGLYPPRFTELKRQIASGYPDFENRITRAWKEVVEELVRFSGKIEGGGSDCIPQVKFEDLDKLSEEDLDGIRMCGCVVIRDVVEDDKAVEWRESLREFVKVNQDVEGTPVDDKQFFQLYWTKAQVQARAHPNFLKAEIWLNNLYHDKSGLPTKDVDLSIPLTYADRFRIRKPGVKWGFHPPHIDGGSIERWEDPTFRKCFEDILTGNWREHDPYALRGRLDARSSLYGRPNQSTVFRTFQGWLSMSETGPGQGTLKVFPNVLLSNAYIILRPFFKPLVPVDSLDILDPKNWAVDLNNPEFPGIYPRDNGFAGPTPTPRLHPHLFLEKTMTSAPKVNPGDTVFWHCDVVHSVEEDHTGNEDSAVMYIPAVPFTTSNLDYIQRQKECFLAGQRPPDFPKGPAEAEFIGIGGVGDVDNELGKRAMGLSPISVS
ncbi:hypothetical protein AGABI2DRAFT_217897 [Agaricus bisporus var. bisporus H97]|uniref:hypothetical protein n=1 Tax=Agaricus bisporus var. bisporus (strain H97 / ATCC MYA-4626 / FGSC 10389) TaxID=936046 RepID=UPI00029F7786|nr:hypothetical protein AGABI2DRAFT_217897 [Agaricus bisporus var. bisporus H97]EKV48932.1 hypothetical protein AGABI2DRAFT_217897 [Agaricus bisporus var. bisporus H97]